ncbi:MAG: carbon-nitrogen hydrolase family protein, partial [Algoriphagus marincola HL-49]
RLLDLGEKELISTIELDKANLDSYRKKFPAWTDADNFKLL